MTPLISPLRATLIAALLFGVACSGGDDASSGDGGNGLDAGLDAGGDVLAGDGASPDASPSDAATDASTTTDGASDAAEDVVDASVALQMGGAMQGVALNLAGAVTTLAGAPFFADGIGAAANLGVVAHMVEYGGVVYFADSGNQTIRKLVVQTGVVTTLAGMTGVTGSADGTGAAARFSLPRGITTDGINLYVADTFNQAIRRIAPASGPLDAMSSANAVVTTLGVAGSPGSADGNGTTARFDYPSGITTDGTNLYVADSSNHTIRRIAPSSGLLGAMTIAQVSVTTLAGTALTQGATDGVGAGALFNTPLGIATDGTNLYVADGANHTIRRIAPSSGSLGAMTSAQATVTTLAGLATKFGSANGLGTTARFYWPFAITASSNALWITDESNHTIRRIAPTSGTLAAMTNNEADVTTFAGAAGSPGIADGTGSTARFDSPYGIATDGTNVYVADSDNHTIRQCVIGTAVTTTIASAAPGTSGAGAAGRFGTATAEFTTDGVNVYVADSNIHTVRKIVIATGDVTTLAGAALQRGSSDGTGAAARFDGPTGITTDGINLYMTDRNASTVRRIAPASGLLANMTSANAVVTTLAGTAGALGKADDTGFAARFTYPGAITTDGVNLYVADTWNHTIRRIAPASGPLASMTDTIAVVTTLAGSGGVAGSADGTGPAATFEYPASLTTDGINLYVADTDNETIRRIAPGTGTLDTMTSANAVVTTLAGAAGVPGSADGTGSVAGFASPSGITSDGKALFVTDTNNHTIRRIDPSSGDLGTMTSANAVVTTVAGMAGSQGIVDATGTSARFTFPRGITTDGQRLLLGDGSGGTLRLLQ